MNEQKESNSKALESRVELKKISKELALLKQEKEWLTQKLYYYEERKLMKLVMEFYRCIDRHIFLKVLANFVYIILSIPIKIFELIINSEKQDMKGVNKKTLRELDNIIKKSASKKIIFFISPIEWDMILKQRPQHIAQYMANEGVLVFYIQRKRTEKIVEQLSSNLYSIYANKYKFIKDLAEKNSNRDIYCQFYSAEWTDINEDIKTLKEVGVKILFEYVDELSPDISGLEIPNHIIKRFEEALKDEESTYIVATASKLYEDVSLYRRKNMALIPNGVEIDHFSQKFTVKDLPFRMVQVFKEKKPIIGYYGAIASWMDFELLCTIAKLKPNYNIVLIGLDYDGSLMDSDIDQYHNIYVFPPVEYKELPRYASFFDVCMIPFKINDVTKSTSPIKLFEYMAMQKPIVTTDLPECRKYKSVLIGDSYKSFVSMLDKALENKKDKNLLNSLQEEALKNTWETRAKEIIKLISK